MVVGTGVVAAVLAVAVVVAVVMVVTMMMVIGTGKGMWERVVADE